MKELPTVPYVHQRSMETAIEDWTNPDLLKAPW